MREAGAAPRRGDVALYAGPAWARWSPADIDERGLGGSETATVKIAEHLARAGYAVSLFGDIASGVHRDVALRHWDSFEPREPRLATVSVRRPELFDRDLASELRLLWATDIDYGDELNSERAAAVDLVVVPSRWHREHMRTRYPYLDGKLRVVSNGVELRYFDDGEEERASRVLYSSAPDRGLDVLLELWPKVRYRVPDAELAYCYPAAYDARASRDGALTALHRRIEKLADQPGVTRLGSVGQRELARVMCSARVWVAPSWSSPSGAPFLETSCIGAIEAQAAGCCVVASAVGALTETVRVGRLIDGVPNSASWRSEFADAVVEGLVDSRVQDAAALDGPIAVRDLGWDTVAGEFAALLEPRAVDVGA